MDMLSQYIPDTHWTESVEDSFRSFLSRSDRTHLFAFINDNELQFIWTGVAQFELKSVEEMIYVLKVNEGQKITAENFKDLLFVKEFQFNYLKTVLNLMNSSFIPVFSKEGNWPESVKKEFMAQLHKFMAVATEACYQNEGYTELYIPNENISQSDPSDKDLVQRLDATIQHWQRQIKEITNNQDSQNDAENSGPLD